MKLRTVANCSNLRKSVQLRRSGQLKWEPCHDSPRVVQSEVEDSVEAAFYFLTGFDLTCSGAYLDNFLAERIKAEVDVARSGLLFIMP